MKPYLPDFTLAFEHVCIHTGGRGVIDEMEKQLKLTPKLMQPSRDALYRFGNVSSSSIWFESPTTSFPSFPNVASFLSCATGLCAMISTISALCLLLLSVWEILLFLYPMTQTLHAMSLS
jgi:hypothetical protein